MKMWRLPFVSVLVKLAFAKCPMGTVQGVNSEDCYYFAPTPTMWLQAEENCMARNGHLTSVSSAMTNGILLQIGSLSSTKDFWLGASWDTQMAGQWAWTDGRRFQYNNWAVKQPINQDSYCASMDMSSGRWYSLPCNTRKPYICKVPGVDVCPPSNACPNATPTSTPPQCPACPPATCPTQSWAPTTRPTTCPSGWTHVAEAEGKCLRVTNDAGSWNDVRAQCKKLGGELVSIHSNSSNYAIRDFAFKTLDISTSNFIWYAIGLHQPTADAEYQWTDGSPLDFTNWYAGDPSGQTFTFVDAVGSDYPSAGDYDQSNGRWIDTTLDEVRWKGVCQNP